jgi:hypothetical protein
LKNESSKVPLLCRLGLHVYQGVGQPSAYFVEMQCEKCGKRKVVPLGSARERR